MKLFHSEFLNFSILRYIENYVNILLKSFKKASLAKYKVTVMWNLQPQKIPRIASEVLRTKSENEMPTLVSNPDLIGI